MSEAKTEEGAAEAGAEAAPKKKMSLLQIGLILQFVVVLGAGGIIIKASLFAKRPDLKENTLKEKAIASIRDESSKIEIFDLEQFVVNLSKTHILKTHIQLEVSSAEVSQVLNNRKPAIRARILTLLSSQKAPETTLIQGKLLLKDAIREVINEELLSLQRGPASEEEHGENAEGAHETAAESHKASAEGAAHESAHAESKHGAQSSGIVRDVYFIDFVVSKT